MALDGPGRATIGLTMRRWTEVADGVAATSRTSEKIAIGWHFDGRVSAVFGTHTHVATADERVLPNGTGTSAGVWSALDAGSGQVLWQIAAPDGGSSSGPATMCWN